MNSVVRVVHKAHVDLDTVGEEGQQVVELYKEAMSGLDYYITDLYEICPLIDDIRVSLTQNEGEDDYMITVELDMEINGEAGTGTYGLRFTKDGLTQHARELHEKTEVRALRVHIMMCLQFCLMGSLAEASSGDDEEEPTGSDTYEPSGDGEKETVH